MIIVIGSQKGGVGKSTLTVAIASYLIKSSFKVLIVDADDQKSIINWYNARDEKLTHIPVIGATGNIKNILIEQNNFYDFVLVDCAGRDCKELRTGLLSADIFLTPLKPSQMDLDALTHTYQTFLNAKDYNEKLECKGVLNMVPTNPFNKEASEARIALEYFKDIQLLQTAIYDRIIHREAWSNAKTIFEANNKLISNSTKKAQEEIELLTKEIIK